MTSKDIVQKAIRRERPVRLPVFMDSLGVSDRANIPLRHPAGFTPTTEGEDE